MKKSYLKLLTILIVTLYSCQEKHQTIGDFKLLPTPQEFEISGGSSLNSSDISSYYSLGQEKLPKSSLSTSLTEATTEADAAIVFKIDSSMGLVSGGYKMSIDKDQVSIQAQDEAGLLYAFESLQQLCMDAAEQEANLPECTITDYPELAYRSIHLDIKHHRETLEYYYALIDKLAHYKVNGIIVEFEDKLKYEQQPVIASSDALSIEEWKKLSDYANERHIEISPLIQGLGHASFILKHDEYKDLRDDPKSDWAFNPLDEKTYDVQFDLYEDALKATPHGKYLHIGGDEVHTNGRNSGKSALELQLIWLNKVTQFAEEHDRIPIFWDDMPLKNAGVYGPTHNAKYSKEETDSLWAVNSPKLEAFLEQFPKNCIYMRWSYMNPELYGNKKAMQWFTDNGLQVMGATAGQTRWVLMPQNESNIGPIRSFALSSIKNNLGRLLLTLWDDDSPHFELYNRGILAFAEYSWAGDKTSIAEMKSLYRRRAFANALADESFAFIDSLEGPVSFWKNALLQGNKRNYLMRSNNPKETGVIALPDTDNPGTWTKANHERLQEAEKAVIITSKLKNKIETLKSKTLRNHYTLEVYEQVNNLVHFSTNSLILLRNYDLAKTDEEREAAKRDLVALADEFKSMRNELETVYGKTRVLNKPDNYILDQDHHVHLANQSTNFDWQFYAEILFLEKLSEHLKQ
ncbi:glycoside hydrolase family 20 zincin-like fold domain-containing protein [Echinicola salinicaeni]|uniref:glycoside hydrolase family 20 zincin-like fold domain-containing protein n=1 Tax=Echinicola salinicaeni TaxID=2762757 RepID=UPI001644C073|nr:glycoside hydrolase family 20 zincin-like fold domain-containing protein [Echinicola salinicaeni]